MKTTRLIGCRCKRREAFSLAVLIGRGLDQVLLMQAFHCSILRVHKIHSSVNLVRTRRSSYINSIVGANGDEDPPVPIPNTEVKLISVENTWRVTAWKNRAVPTQRKITQKRVVFRHIVSANGGEDPPVPIPNTEVKLTSVENTWRVTAWKDRAVLTFLLSSVGRACGC